MADETPHPDPPRDGYRFLTDAPPPVRHRERTAGGFSLSLAAHAICLLVVTLVVSRAPIGPS
ncbi:MAG TPA: hypothetical protein VFJ02_01620, partial [Vicinamibacterales bacterium]|nr:hypothetical protein [Vicinamibacterales bacterium]